MHVVIVIAEPRTCCGAFCATKAENCGESDAAINPQNIIMIKNRADGN